MTNRPLSDMKKVLPPTLTMLNPWIGNAFNPSMLALESQSAALDTDGEAGWVLPLQVLSGRTTGV